MAQKSYALEHLILFHLQRYGKLPIEELIEDVEHWAEQLKLTTGKYALPPMYGDVRSVLQEAMQSLGVSGYIGLDESGQCLHLTALGGSVVTSLAPHAHYFERPHRESS